MNQRIISWQIVAIFFIMLTFSCKKEITSKNSVATVTNFNESVSVFYNPFGVYVAASAINENLANTSDPLKQYELTYLKKIPLAVDYGVAYMRMMVYQEKWKDTAFRNGFLFNFTSIVQNGMKVLLNVNSNAIDGNAYPFPDANAYSNFLKEILDTLNKRHLKAELIVVENEETNGLYHTINLTSQATIDSSLQCYVNELTAAANVCKNYTWWDGKTGVKITNGGFTTGAITYNVWDWLYNDIKDTANARKYAVNSMAPKTYNNLYTSLRYHKVPPLYIQTSINMGTFLQIKYQTISLSYTNIHWFEPIKVRGWNETTEGGTPWSKGVSQDSTSKNVLETSITYYTNKFTPKVISNAIGQLTTSANLTNDICAKVLTRQDGAFYYACWFDGDGNNYYDAKALHNTLTTYSYTIRPSGSAFKQRNTGVNK